MKLFTRITTLCAIGLLYLSSIQAAEIEDVIVVTDKIIIVHFDEGELTYPNTLDVTPLDMGQALLASNYYITSADDANYSGNIAPDSLNRRTFGSKFQSNSGGIWAGNRYDPTGKPWVTEHWIYLNLPTALQDGSTYTVNTGALAETSNEVTFTYNVKSTRSEAVHVNTIGYATNAPKYGYVHHWAGDMGGVDFTSYEGNTFNVYNVNDLGTSLASGQLVFRKSATNQETTISGDTPDDNFLGSAVYECDFSSFTGAAKGEKYVLVVDGLGCSYPFEVGEDAVWDAYYYGIKALLHQRNGIRLDAPYAYPGYYRPVNQNPMVIDNEHADPAYHSVDFSGKVLYSTMDYSEWADGNTGKGSEADIIASAEGNPLNITGWYHDAGDWDAYHHHHRIPHLLMCTYEYFPERFGDDELTIPESGNGIPDIVDEAAWLIKFNYRMRRELMKEGYSDGGVGGARVCSDVYNNADGNAQKDKPSWQDYRRIVVTKADAFMTYIYAAEAAQFAYILKGLGKDPKKFPVENLDAIDYANMSYDTVDFVQEAIDAYEWATAPENQPLSESHPHVSDLGVYRMTAATALYRLTGETKYHTAAKTELNKIRTASNWGDDRRFAPYIYLKTNNFDVDTGLISDLKTAAVKNGEHTATNAANDRGCRNGGVKSMPMLIGQATTPWMFEAIMAFGISGEKRFEDVAHTTADYYLGTNPRHTTWMVNVGPRGLQGGFHLDTRNTGYRTVYPGWIPYGPWSMSYVNPLFTWTMDGVEKTGGMGAWDSQWANYSVMPVMEKWPGHERWNNNIHAPLYAENTVHQNAVHAGITYGFVNARNYTNAGAAKSISTITLDKTDITFTLKKESSEIMATFDIIDPICPQIIWSSSDETVAHVNNHGVVTAIDNGTATITCSTLDGSVTATCNITCDNLQDVPVQSIESSVDSLFMGEGQRIKIYINVLPENATNKTYTIESLDSLIGIAIDDEVLAYSAGETHLIVSSNDAPSLKDTIFLSVREAGYHVIVDFDDVVPVTTEPQPFTPQFFSVDSIDVNADNPLVNGANPSAKVVKMIKNGTWRTCGVVTPTKAQPRICKYSEIQFKYYGSGINHLYLVANYADGTKTEIREDVVGQDDWQLFTMELAADGFLKTVIVFPNPEEAGTELTCYFDDFQLVEDFSKECLGQILVTNFEDKQFNWSDGTGAFSWASSNSGIVSNPLVNENNPSNTVFHWKKDPQDHSTPPMVWGGFGLDFNGGSNKGGEVNTVMWESFEFQVYSTQSFSGFTITLTCTDEDENQEKITKFEGEVALDASVIANQWNTVSFKLSDLDAEIEAFNVITMMAAGGEEIVADIYIDSIILKGFAVQSITIDGQDEYEKGIGDQEQLSATISPAEANQELMWQSTNTNVVSVDFNGLVTVEGSGEAYIKAISKGNPKLADSVLFSIDIPLNNLQVSGDPTITLPVDSVHALSVTYTPSDATLKDVTWSSSDNSVAEVSGDGTVTCISVGTAVITVTSVANPALEAAVVVKVVEALGIADKNYQFLTIFPNPAQNHVHLASKKPIHDAKIITMSGGVLKSINLDGKKQVDIDLAGFQPGCYIIKVNHVDGYTSNKVLLIQ